MMNKFYVAGAIWILLATGLVVSSCASPCVSNPRSMSCMSVDELERELSQ